jgi:Asp-tRNA(Asn)/Glu-tRNA(Gln) amidotransferase C subunit
MRPFICQSCRSLLRQSRAYYSTGNNVSEVVRTSTEEAEGSEDKALSSPNMTPQQTMIDSLLSYKSLSWSVKALLPKSDPDLSSSTDAPRHRTITTEKLEHLLRLSALPIPDTVEERTKMLDVLESQLHFVRAVKSVNTEGVEPLVQLRDETEEGTQDITIGPDTREIREALANEDAKGRNKRPRRRKLALNRQSLLTKAELSEREISNWNAIKRTTIFNETSDVRAEEKPVYDDNHWDVLATAEEKVGRYFVVRSGKSSGRPIDE